MKKLTRVIAIALSMMLVFFNEPFFIHAQNEASDFSQFITSASLAYQDAKGYTAYSEDAVITETTPLLFKVEADLPSSALSSDHTINYALPEGLNLDETTSTDVYLKGDETHAVGTYTIKQKNMTIDFSSLDYGSDESKTVIVEIKTTPEHLIFSSTEAKIYFKKATSTSPSEVMVSVMQNYQTDSAATENKTTTTTKQATSVKTKKAVRKNSVNTVSDDYTEISDNLDDQVIAGLSGKYRLKSLSYINGKIGTTVSINTDVTIDLNGQKLQLYDGVHFDIGKKGHLTIEDSKASNISVTEKGTTDQTGNLSSLTTSTQGNNDNRYVPVTLDYYVTKATPKNTTTEDQTIKYEADLSKAGRIYSEKNNPTFYIEKGGNLDFNSGVAYNPDYFVVETQNSSDSTQAVFNLSGGYLIGNRRASVLSNNTNNKITMSGGVITNGKASSGGGIYNMGGTIDLKGGIITGNEAYSDGPADPSDEKNQTNERYSGAGIYMKSGTLNISGDAYITNNEKSEGSSTGIHAGIHGGGGVAADHNSIVNMSGGYVTGNYSHEAGGGLYIGYYTQSGNAKFTLTGGIIASNVAETGEGGGIRIGGAGRATVRATSKNHPVYITNNKTNTGTSDNFTGDWGGGGIFVQTNGQMTMMNALITKNTAGGFGAGVSACPTGNTKIVTEQGAAIYGNDAKGKHCSGGSNGKNEDAAAYQFYQNSKRTDYQDYFLAHAKDGTSHTITDAMLGGGSEGYTGTFNQESRTSTEQEYNYDNQTAVFIGLSASPNDSDKSKALALASTYISGNYSHNHGGGIMTNGMLTLGESNDVFPSFQLNAYKAFLLSSADGNSSTKLAIKKDQFKFALYKHTGDSTTLPKWNGTKFTEGSGKNTLVNEFGNESADANALGKISAEIPNVYYDEAGKYTFYLIEEDTENSKISYDHSIYKITFEVNPTGTKTIDNLQTTIYSIQNVNVSKITADSATALGNKDYNFSNNLLTLYNSSKQAFTNTEQSYDFKITKKDKDTDQALSGAEFTLYQLGDQDKDQTALTKLKTVTTGDNGQNGQAVFSSLRKGHSYYLKETKAPAHYEKAGPWIIQLSDTGEMTFYDADCSENSDSTLTKNSSGTFVKGEGTKLTNTKNVYSTTISDTPIKYTMPSTGGTGIHGYYQLGILFLILGNVFWMIKRRAV